MSDRDHTDNDERAEAATGELPFQDVEETTEAMLESEDDVEDAVTEVRDIPEDGVAVDDGGPDWAAIAGETDIEEFTSEEYLKGTTQEYRGLAEEVERASAEQWEQQAVAASLAGVESGLVGFGDVSGTASESEESYEAVEQAASSDLTMRIGSAIVIFGLFLGSLVLGGWWFTIFVILVMVVSLGEFYATVRTRGYRPLALFGLIGVLLMGVGAQMVGPMAIGGWAAATAIATVLFFSLTPRRDALSNTSVTVLGMAWTGMLAFAVLVAAGPNPVSQILFVVIVVASNDMGGYFVGRSFGRRRLAPTVSPNKTVEGFIGGLLLAAVVASVLAVFPPWENIGIAKALVSAGLISLFAPLGDLAESMVKRNLGVKDMGSVLPGHGGMLDRIDGFLFAVPAIYVLFRGFGLL
ncbi:MAG TPA: phosphatidate cytidylyltransferase [Acidimicrobiia bacterium]|nr:phosphatidate cytidylyltransferase [Acidimicrobiia bacterium]